MDCSDRYAKNLLTLLLKVSEKGGAHNLLRLRATLILVKSSYLPNKKCKSPPIFWSNLKYEHTNTKNQITIIVILFGVCKYRRVLNHTVLDYRQALHRNASGEDTTINLQKCIGPTRKKSQDLFSSQLFQGYFTPFEFCNFFVQDFFQVIFWSMTWFLIGFWFSRPILEKKNLDQKKEPYANISVLSIHGLNMKLCMGAPLPI